MSAADYRKRLRREFARAERASARATERRASLPPGSSRARVTTANARWARAAEYRDLIASRLAEAERLNAPDPCDHAHARPAQTAGLNLCPGCGALFTRRSR